MEKENSQDRESISIRVASARRMRHSRNLSFTDMLQSQSPSQYLRNNSNSSISGDSYSKVLLEAELGSPPCDTKAIKTPSNTNPEATVYQSTPLPDGAQIEGSLLQISQNDPELSWNAASSTPERAYPKFSSTRRLKAAGRAIMAMNRFSQMAGSPDHATTPDDSAVLHEDSPAVQPENTPSPRNEDPLRAAHKLSLRKKLRAAGNAIIAANKFSNSSPSTCSEASDVPLTELEVKQQEIAIFRAQIRTAAELGQALLEEKLELEDLVNDMDDEINRLLSKIDEQNREIFKHKKLYSDKCEEMDTIYLEIKAQKNQEIQNLLNKLQLEEQKNKKLQDDLDEIHSELKATQEKERRALIKTDNLSPILKATRSPTIHCKGLEGFDEFENHSNCADESQITEPLIEDAKVQLEEKIKRQHAELQENEKKLAHAEREAQCLKARMESLLQGNEQLTNESSRQQEMIVSLRKELTSTKQQLEQKEHTRWQSTDLSADSSLASISHLLNQSAIQEASTKVAEKAEDLSEAEMFFSGNPKHAEEAETDMNQCNCSSKIKGLEETNKKLTTLNNKLLQRSLCGVFIIPIVSILLSIFFARYSKFYYEDFLFRLDETALLDL